MKKINKVILTVLILINAFACAQQTPNQTNMKQKIVKSEEQWKKDLSKEEYEILRKKGTITLLTNHQSADYIKKATDTFSESIFELMGMLTVSFDRLNILFEIPLSSDPSISPTDFLKSTS